MPSAAGLLALWHCNLPSAAPGTWIDLVPSHGGVCRTLTTFTRYLQTFCGTNISSQQMRRKWALPASDPSWAS